MMNKLVKNTVEIINKMFFEREIINFYTVAKKADVSRQFLYNHKELKELIIFYKSFNNLPQDRVIRYLQMENKSLLDELDRLYELAIKRW